MRKILVVVDMQKDFVDKNVLGNDECFAVIEKIKNKISNGNYDEIIFTQDTHPENYLETREGKKLPVKHCINGTDGWNIVEDLVIAAKNSTANKVHYICKETFGSVDLGNLIKSMGEDIVVEFVGVCTGICVISNVLLVRAFCPEINLIVDSDCCSCVTIESHNVALEAMKMCQVDVI